MEKNEFVPGLSVMFLSAEIHTDFITDVRGMFRVVNKRNCAIILEAITRSRGFYLSSLLIEDVYIVRIDKKSENIVRVLPTYMQSKPPKGVNIVTLSQLSRALQKWPQLVDKMDEMLRGHTRARTNPTGINISGDTVKLVY